MACRHTTGSCGDDHLMKISHAFRGEEWFTQFTLFIYGSGEIVWRRSNATVGRISIIMGPNGKLSKRDGAKYGFPVFCNELDAGLQMN